MVKKRIINRKNRVSDFLKKRGCPPHVIQGGLSGLVENWEGVVKSVGEGYQLGLDDYLNDLDVRQLLEEVLTIGPIGQKAKYTERVQRADELMKSYVKPTGKCLWGKEEAESQGWAAEKNWWYFTQPIHANPELLSEIENV